MQNSKRFWNHVESSTSECHHIICVATKKLVGFHRYLKKNFRAVISEGKSWQEELPKIPMLCRASPHPVGGKSPTMLFDGKICMKVPHIECNTNTALDQEHRAGCDVYQTCLKDYHDAKQHTTLHDFNIVDIVYCTNMKPSVLNGWNRTRHWVKKMADKRFSSNKSYSCTLYVSSDWTKAA